MHKYQPRLIVTPHDRADGDRQIFSFPITEFVGVTAYQNTIVSKTVHHNDLLWVQ